MTDLTEIERLEALADTSTDVILWIRCKDCMQHSIYVHQLKALCALARRGLASPRGEAVAIGQNVTWLSRIGKLWAGTVEAVTYKLRLEDGCTVEGADREDFRLADPILSAASPSAGVVVTDEMVEAALRSLAQTVYSSALRARGIRSKPFRHDMRAALEAALAAAPRGEGMA